MKTPSDFDLALFLPYLLNQAAEASVLGFQGIYKDRYGLLRTDWRVLFHLGLYGELTAQEISARASLHKTKISRAVQRLEELKFLQRRADATDRRREPLKLTPTGHAAYADLRDVARDHEARLVRDLSDAELDVLRRALVVLERNGRRKIRI